MRMTPEERAEARRIAATDPIGFSGQHWPQTREEIDAFIALLVAEGVRSYLEIGCRYGDTFHAVGMALPEGSRLVAIDLPDAKNGRLNIGRHPRSADYLHRAARDLARNGRTARVILGSSQAPDAIKMARELGPYDAVLIDGDHTPEGVRADWANYSPLGRIVALHDIFGDSSASRGPRPLFKELKTTHRHVAIGKGERRGFGVLWRE